MCSNASPDTNYFPKRMFAFSKVLKAHRMNLDRNFRELTLVA
jgi:hypothetical protein